MISPKDYEFKNCYMLGSLAEDSQYYPTIGEDSAVISPVKNSSGVVFYIKALSPDPEKVIELDNKSGRSENFYIGFDNLDMFPPNFFGLEYNIKDDREKVKFLYDKLKGKLVLFQPVLKPETKQEGRFHKNLRITALEEEVEFNLNSRFIPVPRLTSNDQSEFENKINNKEVISLIDYNHYMGVPEYVICNDTLYFSSDWMQDPSKMSTWIQAKPEHVKKIDLNDNFHVNIISEVSNNLIFLREDYLINLKKDAVHLSNVNDDTRSTTNSLDSSSENEQNESKYNRYNLLESLFIDNLKQRALNENLIYSEEDLLNFHVSVKTNPLTIIAGMTGTGKSQLATLYGETLGLKMNEKEESNMLFLPISPSYTEPSDILGYLNPVSNLYMASSTDLVDFLIAANKNKNKMYMVIFDEMNLSQVEHWFAPFISMLELKENKRYLSLYSEQIKAHNGAMYPPKIPINNNVIFVGTVNMDETTKDFSDRVLDRANIITLKKKGFYESKNEINEVRQLTKTYSDIDDAIEIYPLTDTYRSWTYTKVTWTSFSDEELQFFDELHKILQKADNKVGVSFRVLDKIGSYINNIPHSSNDEPLLSRRVAFDFQVKQRILTKLRGSVEQYGDVIGKVNKPEDAPVESKLYEFFKKETAQNISDFEQSLKIIVKKARELALNGYAT